MQSMAKEVWYFTQVSGTDEGRRFKSRDLDRAGILVTFPAGHPQWSSEPQAHHKRVTLQKWRPGTPEPKSPPCVWLEQKEGSKRNRGRKSREGGRERERERGRRRRPRAHSEGQKCSTDDEIGGAVERANRPLFHHMSNTARKCICTGDGVEGGKTGGREQKMGGRWRDIRREREKEWEGSKRKLWEGWRRKNDTEIHSSGSAQTQCAHFHAILGYIRLREEEGHAEDTLVEGEVNLIPLFRHRPVCSNSNMSNRLSKIHAFGWEQGIRTKIWLGWGSGVVVVVVVVAVVRMQIEEAPLCTDGDPMPGSACGGEGREGGEGRRVLGGEGVPSLCLVGGGGAEKEKQAVLVQPGCEEGPQI
ncbi:hypothetical protein D4764_13G0004750 [Takifugu flavidus]|uniref:Uncharacterized protein n=1 Tax=Takifugu flavidus TaxID=433684 RepID=A0A5C6P8M1_9TELE|nr:hypothetical protein D4764_13G0004750 [Takifugu flavidus]